MPLEDLYIYTGAVAVIGISMGGPAVKSLVAGNHSIPTLLMAIGGTGMLVTAGYKTVRTDPEEFSTSAVRLIILAGAACLTLIGTILSVQPGS